jgi:hypothetical protein
MIIGQCIGDENAASQIPNAYSDMNHRSPVLGRPSQQETKVYNAVLDKYTEGQVKASTAPTGYQAVLRLACTLYGMQGQVTRECVTAYLNAMPAPSRFRSEQARRSSAERSRG